MRVRVLTGGVLVVAVGVAILLVARSLGWGGGGREVSGVPGPDGIAARSLILLPGVEGGARTSIKVYEPADGTLARLQDLQEIRFRWSAVPDARGYLFVANNEIGELVWRGRTADTVLVLPATASNRLFGGDRLKWMVQAQKFGASSDLHRIEIIE